MKVEECTNDLYGNVCLVVDELYFEYHTNKFYGTVFKKEIDEVMFIWCYTD